MEKSESGAPIYRHNVPEQGMPRGASGNPSTDEISDHIEKYVGPIHSVFHELASDLVHIDVHWVQPSNDRPYHTLVTSGMSDLAMHTPNELEGNDHAELSICLPKDWKLSEEDFEDEDNYWPIRWLKYLARFPHQYGTWLGHGHTIPNGNPPETFASNTQLNTMVLLPSVLLDEGFHQLQLPDKTINFYTLIPLYEEEVQLKMKKGVDALYDGFDKHNVSDIIDINRPNTAKRKKLFGLF